MTWFRHGWGLLALVGVLLGVVTVVVAVLPPSGAQTFGMAVCVIGFVALAVAQLRKASRTEAPHGER
jgi:hypothetical protein